MFKSSLGGSLYFEENDILAFSPGHDGFSGKPLEGTSSSGSNTNICEYDPLDMSQPIRLSVDDHVLVSGGNKNVCEYDPLNISTPIDTVLDGTE